MRRGKRKERGGIEGLSTLMARVHPARQPDQVHAQRLFASWGRVVSGRILRNARPVGYRDGILTVHTSTSAWANALSLESDNLLTKLRNRIPGCKLRALRFRAGPLPEDWPEPPQPAPVLRAVRPLSELPEDVARALARIDDDKLREKIAIAASISLSNDKRSAD